MQLTVCIPGSGICSEPRSAGRLHIAAIHCWAEGAIGWLLRTSTQPVAAVNAGNSRDCTATAIPGRWCSLSATSERRSTRSQGTPAA